MVADGSRPEFAADMLALFVSTAAVKLTEIDTALSQGDAACVRRLLHTLKSSAAQVGALELSALAARFEALLLAGEAAQSDWSRQLRDAWSRLEVAWQVQTRPGAQHPLQTG